MVSLGQDFKKVETNGFSFKKVKEFKDKVWPDIRSHLDEQKVEKLEKVTVMADDYALIHQMSSKSGTLGRKGTVV